MALLIDTEFKLLPLKKTLSGLNHEEGFGESVDDDGMGADEEEEEEDGLEDDELDLDEGPAKDGDEDMD